MGEREGVGREGEEARDGVGKVRVGRERVGRVRVRVEGREERKEKERRGGDEREEWIEEGMVTCRSAPLPRTTVRCLGW